MAEQVQLIDLVDHITQGGRLAMIVLLICLNSLWSRFRRELHY